MRGKRTFHRIGAFLLSWAICFQLLGLFEVTAANYQTRAELGGLEHYNGIVFDYFESAQADMEGAMAIGGPSRIALNGGYDFGAGAHHWVMGPYDNPGNHPTLLLGGAPTLGSAGRGAQVNVYGGPVVMAQSLQAGYLSQSSNRFSAAKGIYYTDDDLVRGFFNEAYATAWRTVMTLDDANPNAGARITLDDFTGWRTTYKQTFANLAPFTASGVVSGGDILVIHVTDRNPVINEPKITAAFDNYQYIVFNFPNAVDAQFTGGSLSVDGAGINTGASITHYPAQNAVLANYAGKVIWNFPRASTVKITACGVVGSVFAPDALLEGNGGSLNGMMIADSFITKNGMELHSFRVGKNIFEIDDNDEETHGRAVLYKYDADNSISFEDYHLLDGAEFVFEQWDEQAQSWTTPPGITNPLLTEFGRIVVEDLQEGDYRFTETQPPIGYQPKNPNPEYLFTIRPGMTAAETVYLYAPNDPYTTGFAIRKTEDDGSTPLEGAVFALYYMDDAHPELVAQETSGSNGLLRFDRLRAGRYLLVEAEAPEGYVSRHLIYDILVSFDPGGVAKVEWKLDTDLVYTDISDGTPIDVINDAATPDEFEILVVKLVEGHDNIPIPGMEFRLSYDKNYDPDSNQYNANTYLETNTPDWDDQPDYPGILETNELGHIYLTLKAGYYRLTELSNGLERFFFVPEPFGWLLPLPLGAPLSAVLEDETEDSLADDADDASDEYSPREDPEPLPADAPDPPAPPAEEDPADEPAAQPEPASEPTAPPEEPAADPQPAKEPSLFDPWIPVERLEMPRMAARQTVILSEGSIFPPVEYAERLDFGQLEPPASETEPAAQPQADPPVSDPPSSGEGSGEPDPDPRQPVPGEGEEREAGGDGEADSDPDPQQTPEDDAATQSDPEAKDPDDDPDDDQQPPAAAPIAPMSGFFGGAGIYVPIYNPAPGRITVIKQDRDSGRVLEGAVFGLYYNIGSWSGAGSNRWVRVATGATDANGEVVFDNLIDGDYRVMEIEAPPGYEEITDPEPVEVFGLSGSYVVTVNSALPDPSFVFLARNPYAAGSIQIHKVDGDSGASLAGASFRLRYWDDVDHAWNYYSDRRFTTDAQGMLSITGLPFGRYKIVEMSPPAGYSVESQYAKDELTFTITSTASYTPVPIQVENFRTPTDPGGGGGNGGEYFPGREISTFRPEPESVMPDVETPDLVVGITDIDNPLTGSLGARLFWSGVMAAVGCLAASAVLYRRARRLDDDA